MTTMFTTTIMTNMTNITNIVGDFGGHPNLAHVDPAPLGLHKLGLKE